MQISISNIITLVAVRSDQLTQAASAVIGGKLHAADYALTQHDADAIAAALDKQAAENTPPAQWLADKLGQSPADVQYDVATKINVACGYAKTIFGLAGLHTPDAWLD